MRSHASLIAKALRRVLGIALAGSIAAALSCRGGVTDSPAADAGSAQDAAPADASPADDGATGPASDAAADAADDDAGQSRDATADVIDGAAPADAAHPGDASACPTPIPLGGWTPPAFVPPRHVPGACSASDITGYDTSCLVTGATAGTCLAFRTAHPTCAACLSSNATDPDWGPLVSFAGIEQVNLAGCIALTAPSDIACARSVEDLSLCLHAACDGVCPVTDEASFQLWHQCEASAEASGMECATYANAANCASDAAPQPCTAGSTFDETFISIATVFCGGGPADASDN
jgi:hypothetical protein